MRNPLRWLYNQFASEPRLDNGSFGIYDGGVIEDFKSDPDNLFLVSFPRTGSHWLRMLIELYVERPLLTRTFFYPTRDDYLLLHVHDIDLEVERSNVLYLYRTPVDTIYSQMAYHGDSFDDSDRISHWTDLYGRHLDKWLYKENFTEKKAILRYEGMKEDLSGEFKKICAHLDRSFDEDRFQPVAQHVTRTLVEEKTRHDENVVKADRERYITERERFRDEKSGLIWSNFLSGREHLKAKFGEIGGGIATP